MRGTRLGKKHGEEDRNISTLPELQKHLCPDLLLYFLASMNLVDGFCQ